MGKSGGTNTVTQDAAPWGPTQPALQFGLSELNRAYGQNPYYTAPASMPGAVPFSTPFGNIQPRSFAPADPSYQDDDVLLQRMLLDIRRGRSPFGNQAQTPQGPFIPQSEPFKVPDYGLIDPALAELRATVSGERLNSNPFLDDAIRLASQDVNSQFAGAGRYGSGAHAQELFRSVAAPIRAQSYDTERARQLAAINQAIMTPYQLYGAQVAAPYEGIRNYLELVNPIARGGSSGTSRSPVYNNPLATAAGLGLTGYGLYSMFGPAASAGGKGAGASAASLLAL